MEWLTDRLNACKCCDASYPYWIHGNPQPPTPNVLSLLAIPTQLTKMLLNLASSIYFPNEQATKKIKMIKNDTKQYRKGRKNILPPKKCINKKHVISLAPTKPLLLLPINWLLLSIQLWQAWAPGCQPIVTDSNGFLVGKKSRFPKKSAKWSKKGDWNPRWGM